MTTHWIGGDYERMQADVAKQPEPRRETAQEFYSNIIALGEYTRDRMLQEMRDGDRPPSITELRGIEESIAVCRAELEKFT